MTDIRHVLVKQHLISVGRTGIGGTRVGIYQPEGVNTPSAGHDMIV